MAAPIDKQSHPVVLFDGVCNLCDASVRFILARDPAGVFRFAPLQSPIGRELLQEHGQPTNRLDGVVLIDGDKCSTKSTAALSIARRLTWPWRAFAVLIWVPRFVRDWAYEVIAANRYRWFGKKDECMIAPPEIRERFLG
jgi:predicted DCC family thiol-disulfide oxidoreductase YuxK